MSSSYGAMNINQEEEDQPLLQQQQQQQRRRREDFAKQKHRSRRRSKAAADADAIAKDHHVYDVLFSNRSLPTDTTTKKKKKKQQQQKQTQQRKEEALISQVTAMDVIGEEEALSNRIRKQQQQQQQQQQVGSSSHRYKHSFVFNVLNSNSNLLPARLFKGFITFVILVDLCLFILSTDPHMEKKHERFFHVAEGIASSIFLVEYIARMVVVTEKKKYRNMPGWKARLQYSRTFPAIIDLLSILPFFLEIPTGLSLPTLTWLRFLRLVRILKSEGSIRALDAVYRVLYYNSEILSVAALVCTFLVLITAFLLYYLRPRNQTNNSDFHSISATMYLSLLMLTGQGGPDSENMPWYTKAVIILTSIFSVAMFAIPASMLTWGFEAEAERMAKRSRRMALNLSTRTESTNWSSEDDDDSSGYSTDEEYFKIIAGEDDESDDDDGEESALMKAFREGFQRADMDHDGTLTLPEFIKMQKATTQQQLLLQQPTIDEQRVKTLEQKVQANSEKLDLILELLQQSKRTGKL